MSRGCRFLVALVALVGCSAPQDLSLGPTGNSQRAISKPDVRESYLIPPEIPASLLTYLFRSRTSKGEITSIHVHEVVENIWTLAITSESLPDGVFFEVHRFAPDGATWRQV